MNTTEGTPWLIRALLLLGFLGAVSLLELMARGRAATRWKDSLLLIAGAGLGALGFGLATPLLVDLLPGEWTPRPGPDQSVDQRARGIGVELGSILGLAIAGVAVFRRRRRTRARSLEEAARPFAESAGGRRSFALAWRSLALISVPAFCSPGAADALHDDPRHELAEEIPDRALTQYHLLRERLRDPDFELGTLDVFVPPFGIIALSHTACGLKNLHDHDARKPAELLTFFDVLVDRAMRAPVSPYSSPVEEVAILGDRNLYLSHLALILGTRRLSGGDDRWDALHLRLVRHLRERSLADPDFHARSFPGSPRFPADQTVVLCALSVHDQIHGGQLSTEPIESWQRRLLDVHTDEETGLPRSCLDDGYPAARLPRGCATTWMCLYAAQFSPELGRRWYLAAREHLFDQVLGAGGFREYPESASDAVGAGSDVDSGPILFGIGVAASGFGLGAARLHGDSEAYHSILRAGALFGAPALVDPQRYHLSPLLGDAILFHGFTAHPWFSPPMEPVEARDTPFPTLALLFLLAHAGWATAWLLSIRRRLLRK